MVVSRSLGLSMVRVAMMPGTAQAKLDEQRNEGASGKAGAVHQFVHEEGGTNHVAARLQQQDEEEEDQDLREEHHHGTDPADHSVYDQRAERTIGNDVRCRLPRARPFRFRSSQPGLRSRRTRPGT